MFSNNDGKNTDDKSFFSIDKEYDTIPYRIDFAKTLLDGNELQPIVNFNIKDTEYYIDPVGYEENTDTSSGGTTKVISKRILDFKKVMQKIGGMLKYVKSGSTGHTFKGELPIDGELVNYAVKVVAYPRRVRYGYVDNLSRPENAELMMIRLLSVFLVKKETPHIILPYGTFNTSIKHFTELIEEEVVDKDNKHYKEFIDRYNKKEYHSQVSILISEWANRGDFLDFIRKHYEKFKLIHWRVFFFQILSVLAVIQSKFPSFRHNDLKANNILLHKCKKKGTWCKYRIDKDMYIIPNIGYKIKLWDFDFACIPGIVNNAKVNAKWTNKINVAPVQNRYYDMHYFFNTLIRKGFFPQFHKKEFVDEEVRQFVRRIIPLKYRKGDSVDKRGRILVNTEYTTPNKILRTDPFFEEFRNKKIRQDKRKIKSSHVRRTTKNYESIDMDE